MCWGADTWDNGRYLLIAQRITQCQLSFGYFVLIAQFPHRFQCLRRLRDHLTCQSAMTMVVDRKLRFAVKFSCQQSKLKWHTDYNSITFFISRFNYW